MNNILLPFDDKYWNEISFIASILSFNSVSKITKRFK